MNAKFENAFILSGGGTRLMIYLGMYAALEKLHLKPNVIIGTCGGAIAATVINAFPDTASQKEYLKSKEYFKFITKQRLTKEKKLFKIGLLSLQKIVDKRNAPFIEDVFNRFLAEMPQDLSTDLTTLEGIKFSNKIPTLILGSQIIFSPKEVKQKRNNRKLYQKVIFTDPETAKSIDIKEIVVSSANYKNSAVAEMPKIITNKTMLSTARISISDMFYVAPVYSEGNYFAGGAIDLIPIELAKHIANAVIIENKQIYSTIEEALVRAVLGYSGNQRLTEIEKFTPNYQIDTRNIKKELEGHYIKKKIHWKKQEICFEYPKNYQQFREDMDKQWEYGFQQTIKSIQKKK
ncbi:patatin-like phospholipase family protein [uncultured Algibacter sp.]|uniref:patatin-like phospholipase family protein n=1 Tax=uncultured Algibacter sp. TaxID=298659 RepID=UPI0032174052